MATGGQDPIGPVDSDFRPQATLLIAFGAFLVVGPFAILHFLQGRPTMGCVALVATAVLAFNAWYLQRESRRRSLAPRLVIAAAGVLLDLYLLATQGMGGLLWGYPTVLWLYCTLPERSARVVNSLLLLASLPLIVAVAAPDVAVRAVATLVGVSLFSCVLVHVISRQQERLQRELRHDPLTGLLNRHSLDGIVERAMARTRRDGVPMALLALDLDHFKRINDELGHAAGDDVLRGLGVLLHEWLRASDVAFRTGGEEFLVLLHDITDLHAQRVAETLLAKIRETALLDDRTVTASIGLAPFDGENDPRAWIEHADEALYRAKHAGRDRVVSSTVPIGPLLSRARPLSSAVAPLAESA